MTTYQPQAGDYIAFSDYSIFIVWHGGVGFSVYDRTDMIEQDYFTNYNFTQTREGAEDAANDWAEDFYTIETEAAYNA